jgi:outer membrane protein assembly factor BamA
MLRIIFAGVLLSCFVRAESDPLVVKSVTLRGTSLHVDFATRVGHPFNADVIDQDVRRLWSTGKFSDVHAETRAEAGGTAVVFDAFEISDRLRVKEVRFVGEPAVDPAKLRGALRALLARRILPGWRVYPRYRPEAVQSDAARLRSFYISQGYFDADVRLDKVEIEGEHAIVRIVVTAGARYHLRSTSMEQLCLELLADRREAQREGVLDFSPSLKIEDAEGQPYAVVASTSVDRGPSYRVGRIDFAGNHDFSDAALRRNLLLDEGQVFDEYLLRKSVARLNQSRRFEPLSERDVAVRTDVAAGVADVRIRIRERKRGAWNLSGPVGPASFAGPVEASLSSRLPPWGSGLLELGTFTTSVSMFAFARPLVPLAAWAAKRPLLPVLALQRPYSPGDGWRSGFLLSPQLGWRALALGYSFTQFQQRLTPLLSGDRGLVPALPVRVETSKGSNVMFCEPRAPRLMVLRNSAIFGLRFFGAFTGL